MLKLENVSAGYNGMDVIHDISFDLSEGQSLCILGPNSCGKTTLLRAIAKLIPSMGVLELDSQSIHDMRRKDIAKRIAVMSQISRVNFPYSVYDTIMMGRYQHIKKSMFKKASEKDYAIVEQCMEEVELTSIKDQMIDCLSGGQLQRVFLAHTLVQEPRLILLDEPTNHLDMKHQVGLVKYLKEWSQKDGHQVIGVFHDINLAMQLSDNLMFMKEGHVKGIGHSDDLITSDFLKDIYDIDIVAYMVESYKRWEKFSK
jgi:iron complex transport system ATP-binding protein